MPVLGDRSSLNACSRLDTSMDGCGLLLGFAIRVAVAGGGLVSTEACLKSPACSAC